jgi:hypothetical protein
VLGYDGGVKTFTCKAFLSVLGILLQMFIYVELFMGTYLSFYWVSAIHIFDRIAALNQV